MSCKKRSIRKRSFLLLELLISIALVSCCLYPLLKPHFVMNQKDFQEIEEMQLSLAAHRAYCMLKTKLFENLHTWEELEKKTVLGTLDPFEFEIEKGKKRTYTCTYKLKMIDQSTKKQAKYSALLLNAKISLAYGEKKPSFVLKRTLFLERISPEAV